MTDTAGDRLDLVALVRPLATYPCSTCGAELVMAVADYGRQVCSRCLAIHGSLAAALASLDASSAPPSNIIQFGRPERRSAR